MMMVPDLLDKERFMGLRGFRTGLVAVLFGFLDIGMHIPAIHTDMIGFSLTSIKFWPSGVKENSVDRSCGTEISLSSPQ